MVDRILYSWVFSKAWFSSCGTKPPPRTKARTCTFTVQDITVMTHLDWAEVVEWSVLLQAWTYQLPLPISWHPDELMFVCSWFVSAQLSLLGLAMMDVGWYTLLWAWLPWMVLHVSVLPPELVFIPNLAYLPHVPIVLIYLALPAVSGVLFVPPSLPNLVVFPKSAPQAYCCSVSWSNWSTSSSSQSQCNAFKSTVVASGALPYEQYTEGL